MRLNTIFLTIGGIVVGFVIGFLLASSINRSEINGLRAAAETARKSANSSNGDLSDEEIRDKIAEADQEPTNADFQKNLGLALYRYGALKADTNVITDAIRLLERAEKLSPADNDIVIGLGNAWFDIGYTNKDNSSLEKARGYYQTVLAKSPQDGGVRTDLGMTYFLNDPPDDIKAIDEFKKALAVDAKNEKALQFIIQSLARQGDKAAAEKYLDTLRANYPSDEATSQIAAQLGSNSNSASK